ncbi:MAG TPA: DegT/DnrJ/EryC1/StrS family aminotransferase [Rubrobacter sp.]|nr:DegT/DnrJ/EryC1/StrS family aminotransferase [Rubrobacter sp.]
MGSRAWRMGFGALAGVGGWRGMYARHRLDISVEDIAFGVLWHSRRLKREKLEGEVLRLCSLEEEGLVCFSVRSGWDLWLGAQGLWAGDEVLVSAVTHPDMVRIISEHGLRAVPVDIDPGTLTPRPCMLEAAFTPRTRVVLVAHLFGGRMDLGGVAKFARERGVLLVEDCAQAFKGPKRMGDPLADVSMYSFGTLKTSTALGGAILRVRDREVLDRMRWIQASYPSQDRGGYLKKLLKVLGLVTVSRPGLYGLLARACRRLGSDLDALVSGVVRGFPPREPATMFLWRLRQRPSAPLLAMLSRRLRTFDGERLARRASTGERFARRLRVVDLHPGQRSLQRTHWLFPVVVEDAEALIASLRRRGLDASQATSSIAVVEAPAGRTLPSEASLMMSGVVFLPVYPELPAQAFDVMAGLVNDCAARVAAESVAL